MERWDSGVLGGSRPSREYFKTRHAVGKSVAWHAPSKKSIKWGIERHEIRSSIGKLLMFSVNYAQYPNTCQMFFDQVFIYSKYFCPITGRPPFIGHKG